MTSSSFVLHVLSSNQSQPTQRGTPQGHSRRLHLVQRGGPFPLFCPPRGLRCSAIFVDFWCRKLRKFRIWLGRACADRYYTNTYYIYIYHIYVRVYIYICISWPPYPTSLDVWWCLVVFPCLFFSEIPWQQMAFQVEICPRRVHPVEHFAQWILMVGGHVWG